MSHKFLYNATFHSFLNSIDQELANKVQQQSCSHCGGKLHQADYPRSPMGIFPEFRDNYDNRFSFCCDTCRKRTTSSSVRFFGRRWYPAPLLVLISALTLGINKRRRAQIKQHFGIVVSEKTWKRWRRWWQESFTRTSFFQQVKGLIPPSLILGPLPRTLLTAFEGTLEAKMRALLRFLSPITAGGLRAV
jgi:hypothetical protein